MTAGGTYRRDRLKPCTALYKHSYPDGVPVCDECCKVCADTPAMGGVKRPCTYLEGIQKIKPHSSTSLHCGGQVNITVAHHTTLAEEHT